jgi:hypothetical protein
MLGALYERLSPQGKALWRMQQAIASGIDSDDPRSFRAVSEEIAAQMSALPPSDAAIMARMQKLEIQRLRVSAAEHRANADVSGRMLEFFERARRIAGNEVVEQSSFARVVAILDDAGELTDADRAFVDQLVGKTFDVSTEED